MKISNGGLGQPGIPGSVSTLRQRGFFNDLKYFLLDNDWTKSSTQYRGGEQANFLMNKHNPLPICVSEDLGQKNYI